MKPKFIFALILFSTALLAQDLFPPAPQYGFSPEEAFSHGETNFLSSEEISFSDLKQMVQLVQKHLGISKQTIKVVPLDKANNAYAYLLNGKPCIGLDTIYLNNLRKKASSTWTVLGIIAHEVGHHYYRHLNHPIEPHLLEAGADFVSGYVLALFGAPKETAAILMQELASDTPTSSHPNRNSRIKAMNKGRLQAESYK